MWDESAVPGCATPTHYWQAVDLSGLQDCGLQRLASAWVGCARPAAMVSPWWFLSAPAAVVGAASLRRSGAGADKLTVRRKAEGEGEFVCERVCASNRLLNKVGDAAGGAGGRGGARTPRRRERGRHRVLGLGGPS